MDEQNGSNKTLWAVIGVIAVILIAGYLIWVKGASQKTANTPSPNSAPVNSTPPVKEYSTPADKSPEANTAPSNNQSPAASAQREITVSGSEFSFNPSAITVKPGEKIKLTFKNTGAAPHNLAIQGLGVSTKTVSAGQTDSVEFTAPQSGTLNFFCTVDSHSEKGMTGTIKVE